MKEWFWVPLRNPYFSAGSSVAARCKGKVWRDVGEVVLSRYACAWVQQRCSPTENPLDCSKPAYVSEVVPLVLLNVLFRLELPPKLRQVWHTYWNEMSCNKIRLHRLGGAVSAQLALTSCRKRQRPSIAYLESNQEIIICNDWNRGSSIQQEYFDAADWQRDPVLIRTDVRRRVRVPSHANVKWALGSR